MPFCQITVGDALTLSEIAEPALYQAASALRRGESGKRAGEERNWSPIDIRRDYFHHPGSGYVKLDQRRFYAEKMGDIVTQRLQGSFEDLLDYGFTASMEESLDEIADGARDWREVLDSFYNDFRQKVPSRGK